MCHIYENINVHELNSAHEKSVKCYQKSQNIIVHAVMMATGYSQPRSVSAAWVSGRLLKGACLVIAIGADHVLISYPHLSPLVFLSTTEKKIYIYIH